jgi:HK97 family phage prohead protease
VNLERRTVHAEVRTSDDSPGLFEAKVMRYDVLDDYRTVFDPGTFRESLEERLPRITWGHDWADVLGQYVDYKDTREHLELVGQLDLDMIDGTNTPAVPRAHQARAQLRSRTITDFSVGFRRTKDGVYKDDEGVEHFRSARLDEVALVLAGAVPGTELLAVRTPTVRLVRTTEGLVVPVETVVAITKLVASGELTREEANIALDLAAGAAGGPAEASGDGLGGSTSDGPAEPDPLDDDAHDVLAGLGLV